MMRSPAVAGMFYESNPEKLHEEIKNCFLNPPGPGYLPETPIMPARNLIGLVCPHAGFIYSGYAAAHAFAALAHNGIPDTIIILSPNHTGAGAAIAVDKESRWSTPLGEIEIDIEIADEIINNCKYAREDSLAHIREHAVEVQIPFLQFIGACCKIVPVTVSGFGEQDALTLTADLGQAIADAIKRRGGAIIASTDLSHYERQSRANTLDSLAIDQILKLDPKGLIHAVYQHQITMCGAIATAAMLEAARGLGAQKAEKLAYYTSGDITGDTSQVVGYAAIAISK